MPRRRTIRPNAVKKAAAGGPGQASTSGAPQESIYARVASIAQALAGLAALVTVLVTVPPALAALQNVQLSQQQLLTTQEGQLTERFTAAVEQIGSDQPEIRLGGIYALERIARDSERDQPVVVEVLCAFIRLHAARQRRPATQPVATEVAAATTVVVRRQPRAVLDRVDLTGVSLSRLNLVGAAQSPTAPNLHQAQLGGAELDGIDFGRADLRNADLTGATMRGIKLRGIVAQGRLANVDLSGVFLEGVNLSRSFLKDAKMTRAKLGGANLRDASLLGADLSGAQLGGARLDEAVLRDANLRDANLQSTYLWSADLSRARNLTRGQLQSAFLNEKTILPRPFYWDSAEKQVKEAQ